MYILYIIVITYETIAKVVIFKIISNYTDNFQTCFNNATDLREKRFSDSSRFRKFYYKRNYKVNVISTIVYLKSNY